MHITGFCDALGIEKPIVYGVSFGGFVAQSYATRHPGHPGKLVLTTTAARADWPAVFGAFERIGGPEAAELAKDYWLTPTAELASPIAPSAIRCTTPSPCAIPMPTSAPSCTTR